MIGSSIAKISRVAWDRYVAFSFVVLVISTYRLWFGQSDFPPVPQFGIPSSDAWIRIAVLSATTIAMYLGRRWSWAMAAIGLSILFVLDQTTMQPWAYLIAIYAALFALTGIHSKRWHRIIAISVYLYSGLGKLDYQFSYTIGSDFVRVITMDLVNTLSVDTVAAMAIALPCFEILAAGLLCVQKTRRIGAILVIVLHTNLIGILGPWALNHSTGVLVWNVVLIGQTILLFWRADEEMQSQRIAPECRVIAVALTALVTIGPAFERSGHWNHWLAWSLYAPHTSRIEVEISNRIAGEDHLLAKYARADLDSDRWRSVDLGRMSLQTISVPIYPQAEYQLRLVRQLMDRRRADDDIRLIWRGPSDRWTGQREERFLRN